MVRLHNTLARGNLTKHLTSLLLNCKFFLVFQGYPPLLPANNDTTGPPEITVQFDHFPSCRNRQD
jgi:hypothetical protein